MFAEVECNGCCKDVCPVCLVNAKLLTFGYVYCGGWGGVVWVPVNGEECDGAGACGLMMLSEDVLSMRGLSGAGPDYRGVNMAWTVGKIEGADPVGVPVGCGESWGRG